MANWEDVYFILAGESEEPSPLFEMVKEYGFSQNYEEAQKSLTNARDSLCQRFHIPAEDRDLEQIMNGVLQIERDIARRAFLCGQRCGQM